MVTDQEIVQWGYLLDPCFELTNTAGKPLTNGWIEVYIQGTRKKYYCASDFNGTLHPFKIPLDSLGSNIVLADPNKAYDVYVYNMFGSLVMSRYNVSPGHASGTAVVGGGDAEHWIGHGGSSVTIESGTYSSPLPLPSSPDYEGTFVDRVVDNEMVLKNGVYLFDAVIRFRQDPQDLTNTIRDLSIHTGLSDTETTVYEMDCAGPDADVDNIHQIRVQFIRHVDSEYNNIFHLQLRSPNDLQFAMIQNLSIIKLGGGSASGGSHGGDYEAGDYVEITDENVINVTGLQPAGNYVSGTTYTHDMYDVSQQLGALSGQVREVSGAIPSLDGYATQDWVEQQGYLTEVPSQYVTSGDLSSYVTETEMESAISGKADTSAIPSLQGYATEDWVNDQGFIKEVPSEYVTESEMSVYVQDHTSGFITSADLPDVSDMATKTWVTDQHYITSADVPPQIEYSAGDNIDITNHVVSVTDTSLLLAGDNVSITPSGNDYIISAQVPETSAFVTDQEMNDAIQSATSAFITSADIPDLPDDLVTSGELATVSGEIVNQIPSLDGYATEDYVTEHTSAFLTSADLPDVSDMATKTWVGEQGYLTSIPSEYVTETELESELSGKADTSAIPDVSNFVTQEDIDAAVSGKMDATESSAFYPMATNPSGYLVSSDLNGYATEQYVQDQTSAFVDSDYVTDYVASQTSGKQDKLTFEYNEESAISAINGSALAGGSSFDPSVLDAYIPYSAAGVDLPNSHFKIDTDGQAYKNTNTPVALEKDSSSTSSVTLIKGGFEIVEGDIITVNGIANGISQVSFTITSTDGDPQYPPVYFATVESDESGNHASWTVDSTYDGKTVSKIDVRASSYYDYIGTNTSATIQYVNGIKYVTEDVLSDGLSSKMDASQSSAFYPRSSNPNNYVTRSQANSTYIPYSAAGVDLPNSNFRIDTSGQAYKIGIVPQNVSITFSSNSIVKPQETLTAGTYELTTSATGADMIDCSDPWIFTSIVNGVARFTIDSTYQSGTVLIRILDSYGERVTDANASNTTLVKMTQELTEYLTSSDLSGYALESYVDSAVSGKQDTLTFGYDESDKINAINGSAIAGGGGGGGGSYTAGEFIDITNDVISVNSGDVSNLVPGDGVLILQTSAGTQVQLDVSAGPGVSLSVQDGTMLISRAKDELLWSGTSANSFTLSEPSMNFERLGIKLRSYQSPDYYSYCEALTNSAGFHFEFENTVPNAQRSCQYAGYRYTTTDDLTYTFASGNRFYFGGGGTGTDSTSNLTGSSLKDAGYPVEIYGINRKIIGIGDN